MVMHLFKCYKNNIIKKLLNHIITLINAFCKIKDPYYLQ